MAETPSWADLLAGAELFRDPILCGVLAGLALGALGVFVVLRRMVFVTAATSQAAGLGVALAFYLEIHLGLHVDPALSALLLSLGTAGAFSLRPERLRLSPESVLGFLYLSAGALAVMVGDRISQESHEIGAILFGTAVLVRPLDLYLVLGSGGLVLGALLFFGRGFVFAGFDRDSAQVQGLPVRVLDGLLWGLVALEVAVATRALGVLPVFAFAVLPAMSVLALGLPLERCLLLAAVFGGLAGLCGYLFAFFYSFPVGASQAFVSAALFAVVAGASALTRRAKP